jgi:glycosyltransferase involved in cell wall biosynthesis
MIVRSVSEWEMETACQIGGDRLKRKRIAIAYPQFGSGGSEARALWALQALRRDYDVSLITCRLVDLSRLNEYYGTTLRRGDFSLLRVLLPPGLAALKLSVLQRRLFQRYCRRVAPQFDLMISAYNPFDFGTPGIQCIADFSFLPEQRFNLDPVLRDAKDWRYRDSPLWRGYLELCEFVSPSNPEGWGRGLVVANSKWSARVVREMFGIESRLLYPPVISEFPEVPFEERETGFVCLGRMAPEKRVEVAIEIINRVRCSGHPEVHLHLVGAIDDSAYGRELRRLCARYHDWIFSEGTLIGERKKRLLAGHRYGIHAREKEPFGIAVAELVKAGCIAFVPNDGGQVEIVDHAALTYSSVEEAAQKILAVLDSAELQHSLRMHLSTAGRQFSVEAFRNGLQDATVDFLRGHEPVTTRIELRR